MKSQQQKRLKYCNKCINKKEDARFGTLCGLTNQIPNFINTCKDFKQSSKLYTEAKPTYQQYNRKAKKTKKPKWIGFSILFTVVVIGLKIARTISKLDDNSNKPEYNTNYLKELQKAQEKRNKVATINYLSTKNRAVSFNRKMKTDTIITLNPKVKLMLPKGFRLSISKQDKELPIQATSRGYYFITNKTTKNNNQGQLAQWKTFRKQLINNYPNSQLVVKKPLTINTKTNDIDRIDFEIKNTYKTILGTARIVDYKNERYFFQLVSDASNADHTKINKYLRYYVKVK